MTFLELRRCIESLSPDELRQQVTIEEDGESYPMYFCNEGQMNVHFVPDHDINLAPFYKKEAL